MRPSCTSLPIETRATSRLTGSKLEITTVSGVSSMMTSTPVVASKALMFLPSRPMTRPFMSSEGSDTALTVDSEVRSEARRSMVVEIRRRASASARSSASSVLSRTICPRRLSSSDSRSENSLLSASVAGEAGDLLEHLEVLGLPLPELFLLCAARSSSVSVRRRRRSSSSPSRLSRAVSLLSRRSSTRAISALLVRTSASASSLILSADFFGREIGLAAFGLGFASSVLEDGARVGPGLGLAGVDARLGNKYPRAAPTADAGDQSQDQ